MLSEFDTVVLNLLQSEFKVQQFFLHYCLKTKEHCETEKICLFLLILFQMFMKHKFPVEVQRWIIGQRIPKDNETLRHCNVKTSGTVVYLYLVSAKSVGINREEVESRHAQQILPQGT